jgi:hypothetical protein
MITLENINKQDACKNLLESPAPIVVGRLIDDIRAYISFVDALTKQVRIHPIDEDDLNELIDKHIPS